MSRLRKLLPIVFPTKWSWVSVGWQFVVGASGVVATILTGAALVAAEQKDPLNRFNSYIWFTLAVMVALGAAFLVVFAHLGGHEQTAQDAIRTRDQGIKLMHSTAEFVRRWALDRSGTEHAFSNQKLRRELDNLLGQRLREYLTFRLGNGVKPAITIKRIDKNRLVSVFRDSGQDVTKRPIDEDESLSENYVFEHFKARVHETGKRRCIVVHDLQMTDVYNRLRSRASERGYRTTLAVPLNVPFSAMEADASVDGLAVGEIVGFFSIDCPQAHAFMGLFNTIDPSKPVGNTGDNQEPKDDMHLLFGLADSIATIMGLLDNNRDAGKSRAA